MDTDVLVVGGGPVGLMLAAELRTGGARVVVLERLKEPSGHSRAFRMQARMLDVLDQRGLLDRFTDGNRTWPKAHFAGLEPLLDFGHLRNEHPYALLIPQARTEQLLEEHTRALGVDIRRGHAVTAVEDTGDGVRCEVETDEGRHSLTASYLVGCDGGRSTVRKLAGIGFTGSDPTVSALLADVELADPSQLPNGVPGTMRTPHGLLMAISLQPGVTRILTTEFVPPDPATARSEVTLDELRATVRRISGLDVDMDRPRWLSRFTDTTRLADTYRSGRVLLAGDAAHVHFPIGAQGLNLGLQDAVNLGWKLAATVTGRAPDGLLDSYGAERRPVAERVLRETRVQLLLMSPDPKVDPLREVFSELLAMPEVNSRLAHEITGLDIRYQLPEGRYTHDLLGCPCPPLKPGPGDGVRALLRAGRGALLVPDTRPGVARAAEGHSGRVGTVPAGEGPGLLLRPDGHVAWVDPGDDTPADDVLADLTDALRRWFGDPAPTGTPRPPTSRNG
ncbi:NAD(P)-binding protein [Streptomyces sp. 3MP-14]|uniref:NAD(P)-binding protein n=1 Tax=Streptomyces mimosae TaxID=2586635 RepID=A0A5N6ANW9_9ACTN|nr:MULTISPECIES: FAD-dependent monooxygenase [Streptomyces]KAB8169925.1 NAD(P)-binding protein [Streptomyces mimosae]KAB8178673.1 NAD(P)-binding protein [Streptomyces sp. 3MP-14]